MANQLKDSICIFRIFQVNTIICVTQMNPSIQPCFQPRETALKQSNSKTV